MVLMVFAAVTVKQTRFDTFLVITMIFVTAALLGAARLYPTPLLQQLGSIFSTLILLLYVRIVLLVMFRGGPITWSRIQGSVSAYLLLGMGGLLLAVLASVGAWWYKHREVANAEQQNSIAVLPLQNLNSDVNTDYLRFALADELSSVLTYSRSLEVRPSSVTRKYVSPDIDPKAVGKELRVGRLLQGHFMKQGDQLTVTLEAIDVPTDRLLWQGTASGKAEDLIGLREQLTNQVQHGLLPILGGAVGTLDSATSRPKNQQAYDLYLRSVASPHDPGPNKEAITMLEWSVGIDSSYAPAWEALGQRYYFDSAYGGGGEEKFQRSNAAYERAIGLDPNRVMAASLPVP